MPVNRPNEYLEKVEKNIKIPNFDDFGPRFDQNMVKICRFLKFRDKKHRKYDADGFQNWVSEGGFWPEAKMGRSRVGEKSKLIAVFGRLPGPFRIGSGRFWSGGQFSGFWVSRGRIDFGRNFLFVVLFEIST